jgi:hypothetical protein
LDQAFWIASSLTLLAMTIFLMWTWRFENLIALSLSR